jgi:glycosyltransferase involved in cell wall biosynthesis
MRIVFITPRLPYPPIEGWRIKEYYILRELYRRKHEIFLIALAIDPFDFIPENIKEIQKYTYGIRLYTFNNKPSIAKSLRNIPLQDILASLRLKGIIDDVNTIIRNEAPDVIHLDTVHMSMLAKFIRDRVPLVASINDSYSFVLRERVSIGITSSPTSLLRWLYCMIALPYITNYERKTYERLQAVHTVSKMDADYLMKLNPRIPLVVIPNGVDVEYFKLLPEVQNEENSLAIVSNFAVDEHVQNSLWFIHMVYKKVKKQGNVKLYLIGKDPPKKLFNEARKVGAIVTGYVKDIRRYISKATLIVDARRQKYGILNHILQSMSMGKCVVGLPYSFLAIEGAESWKNCVIVRGERDFASKIIYLLENEKVRKMIGKNARHLVETQYPWRKIVQRYERMYEATINKFSNM